MGSRGESGAHRIDHLLDQDGSLSADDVATKDFVRVGVPKHFHKAIMVLDR